MYACIHDPADHSIHILIAFQAVGGWNWAEGRKNIWPDGSFQAKVQCRYRILMELLVFEGLIWSSFRPLQPFTFVWFSVRIVAGLGWVVSMPRTIMLWAIDSQTGETSDLLDQLEVTAAFSQDDAAQAVWKKYLSTDLNLYGGVAWFRFREGYQANSGKISGPLISGWISGEVAWYSTSYLPRYL